MSLRPSKLGPRIDPADPKRKASRLSVERLSDGFGMRTRVMSMVECLERRGTLNARQARAGVAIYQAWALGIMGARDAEASGNGSDPGGYTDAQLDAAQTYRELRDAVGGRLWPVVFAVACEDWSPARFANERGHGMDPKGAIALLRVALDTAADCLGDLA
jgi:hypothetical protein